jgi:hypothetical protein
LAKSTAAGEMVATLSLQSPPSTAAAGSGPQAVAQVSVARPRPYPSPSASEKQAKNPLQFSSTSFVSISGAAGEMKGSPSLQSPLLAT